MTASRVSVSTWALHRALGVTHWDTPENPTKQTVPTYGAGSVSLLEIPGRLAAMGIGTMELCHFHLPSRDAAYVAELRGALDAAGVELWSLLVDAGDITHPEHGARDAAWIGDWIDMAAPLGAKRARVIAGKQTHTPETRQRSEKALRALADRAAGQSVRLMTENWFGFLAAPSQVQTLLDELDGQVGLCADFGNWDGHGARKYDDLAAILPRAESCHAKSRFAAPGVVDTDEYRRCLDLARDAGFAGPYTLVYGGAGDDDWEGIALQRDVLLPYVTA